MGHISIVSNEGITSQLKGNANKVNNFEGRCFIPRIVRKKKEDAIFHVMARSIREVDLFKAFQFILDLDTSPMNLLNMVLLWVCSAKNLKKQGKAICREIVEAKALAVLLMRRNIKILHMSL